MSIEFGRTECVLSGDAGDAGDAGASCRDSFPKSTVLPRSCRAFLCGGVDGAGGGGAAAGACGRGRRDWRAELYRCEGSFLELFISPTSNVRALARTSLFPRL